MSQEKVRELPVGVALPNAEYERQLVPLVQNIYTGHSEVWSKLSSYIFWFSWIVTAQPYNGAFTFSSCLFVDIRIHVGK